MLTRRNAVLILLSVELMLNAVSLNMVAFAVYGHIDFGNITGIVFAFFIIVIAAAEVALAWASWCGRSATGRRPTSTK